jgi:hypothetical protein
MVNELSHVDLAFVVDTTGSMGAFIDAARRQMTATLRALTAESAAPIDLRLAVVEYRDHPPQDTTFTARVHGFTPSLARAEKGIAGLTPEGGGDAPEAVFDGLEAAAVLPWRPHARRLAVLIGDSPPHGCGAGGDGFPKGCPCGLTNESATALLEAAGVTLYAVGLTPGVKDSFGRLAAYTGGEFFEARQGDRAIEALKGLLKSEFEGVELDGRVLALCRDAPGWTVDGLNEALPAGRNRIAASLGRLGRRGLLGRPA